LAYIVHAENKDTLLADPEGILNTFTATYQYIVGCNPSIIAYPQDRTLLQLLMSTPILINA
jgi:hypothetical protein